VSVFAITYQLRLRTERWGNLVVRSDQIALGVLFILCALFWAGLWLALTLETPDRVLLYDFWDEPRHFDTAELNRIAERVNRTIEETGIDAEPIRLLPPYRRDDPGGFNWGWFAFVALQHGIVLVGLAVGVRLMFTGTRVVFNPRERTVAWMKVGLIGTKTWHYELDQMLLTLHPTVVSGKAWDWQGYALTLEAPDGRRLKLGRHKDSVKLREYASVIQEQGGLELQVDPFEQ